MRDDEVERGGKLRIDVRIDTDADYHDPTGRARVVAKYLGDGQVDASTSNTEKVTVTRK